MSALCSTLAISFSGSKSAHADDPANRYEKVHTIKLGGEGRWDFLEVDEANRRLFVARETRVVVVDLDAEKPVGEIPLPSR